MARTRLTWDWRWQRQCREIVGDAEAFLLGHIAERFEEQGLVVPTWAWTNLLAHGEASELRDERAGERQPARTLNRDWRRARAYLAAEVLSLVGAHVPLHVLQERVLHPVELALATARTSLPWGPSQWAMHVSSALTEHAIVERRLSHHVAPRE